MKAVLKICAPLLASVLLAGCGGGGADGGIFTPPPPPAADYIVISLQTTTQTLPLNTNSTLPNPGGPFTSEVKATLRYKDSGKLVDNINSINVSISPVSVATFSPLDDPSTTDKNEIQERLGQGPVKVVAGEATIFVTSNATAGTAELTITAPPVDGINVNSASMTFTVTNATAPLPADIQLSADNTAVYLAGSGGKNTSLITALVTDGSNQTVPDPAAGNSGNNNVLFEVVGGASNGTLSGNSASGASQNGPSIKVATTKGIAQVSFRAGTSQGPVTIKATADAADNNVDNGIDDPVSSTLTLVVSDGTLYSLEITSPVFASKLSGITINTLPVSGGVTPPASTGSVPPNPDASLSLAVSVLATDRQGNPVVPGTTIRFGSVDEPVAPFDVTGGGNYFQIAGNDGNPKEGGNLFTAPGGQFITAGGGAGPGDALIVFGKAVQGNADLESAVTVAHVNSQTSMNVTPNFNLNDTTGSSVDYGATLPYLVGRSVHGNITGTSTTNAVGVASAKLTYTVREVGHAAAIWAQGQGADRVTDALTLTYPGVAPATITAYPNPIPGNTTTSVTACVEDAIGTPLRGFPVSFAFQLSGGGTGSLDGTPSSGTFDHYTGADGCTVGQVKTSGLPAAATGGNSGQLMLSAAGASTNVDILVGIGFLSASSSGVCGTDGDAGPPIVPARPETITITAHDTGGNPLSGVQISATCTNGATVTPGSGATDANGNAVFQAVALDATQAQCTFTADQGRSVTANVQGSGGGFSPVCPL